MKSVIIALITLLPALCYASGDELRQTKVIGTDTAEQLYAATVLVLKPVEQRLEDGHVELSLYSGQHTHEQLDLWQKTLSNQLYLPVVVKRATDVKPGYQVKISVVLISDTCRYSERRRVSSAECRRVKNQRRAMVKPEHYRNGQPLIIRDSILEVGAVERLRAGQVRVAEEPDTIVDGGESGGN